MEDTRCCGTGTCLIDVHGRCWCGQQWDGAQMCQPGQTPPSTEELPTADDASKGDDEQGQGF